MNDKLRLFSLQPPIPEHGPGRLVKLNKPITIEEVVQRVKSHLNLQHVRLALAVGASKGITCSLYQFFSSEFGRLRDGQHEKHAKYS